jgi:hypothetical protein
MTEVEMTRLLQELSQTAKTLNKESDSLNELISQIEKTLAGFNVGLEVWLENHPIESRARMEEDPHGEEREAGRHELQLGYAKLNDLTPSWNLVLRQADYKQDNDGGLELLTAYQVRKLLDASRGHRIAAIALLPVLVEEIKDAAQAAVKAIEAAKMMVK